MGKIDTLPYNNVVILFVLYHHGPCYGADISRKAFETFGHTIAIEGIYSTIYRMEESGCITWTWGKAGFRRTKFYELTAKGKEKCEQLIKLVKGPKLATVPKKAFAS